MTEKISLRNLEFIMSYRKNSQDREDNLYANLRYLDATFDDYQVILLESDTKPNFDWSLLNDAKIKYQFFCDQGAFPKSSLYNKGLKSSSSPVVCFLDVDCILTPQAVSAVVNDLLDGTDWDMWSVFDDWVDVFGDLKINFMKKPSFGLFRGINRNNIPQNVVVYPTVHAGGALFVRRNECIRIGGFDERMRGWGAEDSEFAERAMLLDVRWANTGGAIYHLHHDGFDLVRSSSSDTLRNSELHQELKNMTRSEIFAMAEKMRIEAFL